MPRLRGHHLVCLHFFRGEGYSEEFVENLKGALRSAQDREIEVVSGADDICAMCPSLHESRCRHSDDAEEGIGKMDRDALGLLRLSHGMKVIWTEIGKAIPGIFPVWYRAYCTECSWRRACEGNERYRRLRGPSSLEP